MKEILFIMIWVVCGIIMLMYYARRKHTFKSVLLGMGSGAAALLLLHYFGAPLGYQPELGLFNMSTALVLGVPGVALIFIVNKFL